MKWKLETRKIGDIRENTANPRTISKAQAKQLQTSIERFGVCEPLVINHDGMLLGGHQRFRILQKIGKSTVDVYVPDRTLDPTEEAELTIRLNKNHGEWDFDMLANCWDADDLVDWGFDVEELGMGEGEGDIEIVDSEKAFRATVTITVADEVTLEAIEREVAFMVDKYMNTTYKIKRGK